MKIEYIHASSPDVVKTYDTKKAFEKLPHIFKHDRTQTGFDSFELSRLDTNLKKGVIISYRVVS